MRACAIGRFNIFEKCNGQIQIGCVMTETRKNSQLASECFNKAGTAANAGAAEALQRMARSYFAQAVALNPSLANEHSELPQNIDGQ
jgi:hypothetical protein